MIVTLLSLLHIIGIASADDAPLYFPHIETDAIIALPPLEAGIRVFATSYNPAKEQTDGSPCTGASGMDLCYLARNGVRTIAVSRDLLARNGGPFAWGDRVKLTSDTDTCDGVIAVVADTMNKRFTKMADLFFLTRDQNTSCSATPTKL